MPALVLDVYDRPATIVEAQIASMSARADSAIGVANGVIADLSSVSFAQSSALPEVQLIEQSVAPAQFVRPVDPEFPEVVQENPDFEYLSEFDREIDNIIRDLDDVGDFDPTIQSIVIPSPPEPIARDAPTKPEITQVTLPEAPSIDTPVLGSLLEVSLPALVEPVLPTFEDIPVEFTGELPSTIATFTEPAYTPAVLDELTAAIRRGLNGGTGITPAVEQALFSAARVRDDSIGLKARQEAFESFSGKGFSMPPGMLVEQVNAATEANKLQAAATSRDILTKSAQWEIENLRDATAKGIALETLLIGQFNNVANRAFEAAFRRLDADIALYGQAVALFNARQAARQINVEVFKGKLQAALSRLDVYKARLEAEVAKASLNESIVRAYVARVDAIRSIVEVYKARIEAAKITSDIERQKVELYGAEVSAYSALIESDQNRFTAYEAQVRGEAAKAQIYQAEAQAFAATVSAATSVGNVKVSAIQAKASGLNASVGKFNALVEAERSRVQTLASVAQSRLSAFQAQTTLASAEVSANNEAARLAIVQNQGRLDTHLRLHEIRLREFESAQNRLIEQSRVVVSAISAAGQITSQLAAGAMSAMHVQASLSGSGSGSISSSSSDNVSQNYNYEVE